MAKERSIVWVSRMVVFVPYRSLNEKVSRIGFVPTIVPLARMLFFVFRPLRRPSLTRRPPPYRRIHVIRPLQVEGLQSCEFLNKLDLTVNFIDLDELESSVSAMEGNRHLGDLYMMGNPCQVRSQPASRPADSGSRSRLCSLAAAYTAQARPVELDP